MRTAMLFFMVVVGAFAAAIAFAGPEAFIFTDRDVYGEGDTIEVEIAGRNLGEGMSVAVYIGLLTADGRLFTLGELAWSGSLDPWMGDIYLPSGFNMKRTPFFTLDVPCQMPPIDEEGEYAFAAGLAHPGTLEFVSDISYCSFSIIQYSDFHGGCISEDMTLSGHLSLTSDLVIQEQAVLTILPGTSVRLGQDVGIHVYGGLIAEGEEGSPIVFERLNPNDPWENISFWQSADDDACRLVGCTITGGSGTYAATSYLGGGVLCLGCSPTIERNTIANNVAAGDGGGIFCRSCSPIIRKNVITGNYAGCDGGGIYCYRDSALIADNVITDNRAEQFGGGLMCCYASCALISNNTISRNCTEDRFTAGAGICCDPNCSPVIECNLISDNSIEGAYGEGGGIACFTNSAVIQGNIITGNHSTDRGGGLLCHSGTETVINNTITGNSATHYGGGIACAWYSLSTIENNEISTNSADRGSGGGICCVADSSPMILSNTIVENSADLKGGGIYCLRNSSPSIWNNAIAGNSAWDGGGLYCDECSAVVAHNTIAGNAASWEGGGICCASSILPTITDCIIWSNSASTGPNLYECSIPSFSCIEGWDGGGEGNILDDPIFVLGPLGEYYLDPSSPCVDAGSRNAEQAGLSDMTTQADGTPDAGIVDMGYHYPIVDRK